MKLVTHFRVQPLMQVLALRVAISKKRIVGKTNGSHMKKPEAKWRRRGAGMDSPWPQGPCQGTAGRRNSSTPTARPARR
eukprot:5806007-Pyramimonas_sp.AAC.1